MKTFKVLDLFCRAGGISKGWYDAGFEVTGVDILDQPEYPYEFVQKDLTEPLHNWKIKFEDFDIIIASPPCQFFTWGTRSDREDKFVNLIPLTRKILESTGKPYVIENVESAKSAMTTNLKLCGEMFGLRVLRHRLFEIKGFHVPQPKHKKHKSPIDKTHSYYACVAGHGGNGYSYKTEDWKKAMGIDWMNNRINLAQAIPPAYSKYIAEYFLKSISPTPETMRFNQ